MSGLKSLLRKLVAVSLVAFHSIPIYAMVANPLIGMIAPLGLEWFLISPWSPFYSFWETRWLVFDKVSLPSLYTLNTNLIVGWCLTAVGIAIFLIAAVQFFTKRKEEVVTSGVYSKVRHPQYLGIIIATLGFTMASERPAAWISWLTLTFLYLVLASSEEKLLQDKQSSETAKYKEKVPFILPKSPFNTRKFRLPENRLRKYAILLLVYLTTLILAWTILRQLSYNPGPFWQ